MRRYSEKLDEGRRASSKSTEEIKAAVALVAADDRAMIDYCRDQIAAFAQRQRASLTEFEVELQDGVRLGQKLIPVATVGADAPGRRHPVGVRAHEHHHGEGGRGREERVIARSPPSPVSAARSSGGTIGHALRDGGGGVDDVYRMAWASGAGDGRRDGERPSPSRWWSARQSVRGRGQAADLRDRGHRPARGPTEILVIADDAADPVVVAADLLGQGLKHGPHRPRCSSRRRALSASPAAASASASFRSSAPRKSPGSAWEDNGEAASLVEERRGGRAGRRRVLAARAPRGADDAVDDWFSGASAEMTARSSWARNRPSPTPTRPIGPNHILPTGRAARYMGGVWAGKFVGCHVSAPHARGRAGAWPPSSRASARSRACSPTRRRPTCARCATGRTEDMADDFDTVVDRRQTESSKRREVPLRRAAALGGRHGLPLAGTRRARAA